MHSNSCKPCAPYFSHCMISQIPNYFLSLYSCIQLRCKPRAANSNGCWTLKLRLHCISIQSVLLPAFINIHDLYSIHNIYKISTQNRTLVPLIICNSSGVASSLMYSPSKHVYMFVWRQGFPGRTGLGCTALTTNTQKTFTLSSQPRNAALH